MKWGKPLAEKIQKTMELPKSLIVSVLGPRDSNLHIIKKKIDANISVVDDGLSVFGVEQEVLVLEKVIEKLIQMAYAKDEINQSTVQLLIQQARSDSGIFAPSENSVIAKIRNKEFKVRTAGQQRYLDSLRKNDITVCVAPPGSSKTYTADVYGLHLLTTKQIDKIIITRPLIEAGGEKVGAEPGDMATKMYNWNLPCLDVFERTLGKEGLDKAIADGKIEMLPLGRMRGLSFYRTYCIADEMQNSSIVLAKLIVTRIGDGSKVVICGDVDQKDSWQESGLEYLASLPYNIDGMGVVRMDDSDVVRHPIITRLLKAFSDKDSVRHL